MLMPFGRLLAMSSEHISRITPICSAFEMKMCNLYPCQLNMKPPGVTPEIGEFVFTHNAWIQLMISF